MEAKQKIRDKEKNYKTCQILLKIKVSAFIVCSVHILKHIYEPHSVAVSRSSLNKGIKVKYCQRVCKKRGGRMLNSRKMFAVIIKKLSHVLQNLVTG